MITPEQSFNTFLKLLGDLMPFAEGVFKQITDVVLGNIVLFRALFTLIALILVVAILRFVWHGWRIYSTHRRLRLRDLMGIGSRQKKRYLKSWMRIKNNIESGEAERMKLGAMQADNLFYHMLDVAGYHGDTLADRLRLATTAQFSNIEELKQAHIFVERIQEPGAEIIQREVEDAVNVYRRALEELYLFAPK